LATGQVVPINPAAAVRGKQCGQTGKMPVLESAEWRKILDSMQTATVSPDWSISDTRMELSKKVKIALDVTRILIFGATRPKEAAYRPLARPNPAPAFPREQLI
jgi:hypothetical protein